VRDQKGLWGLSWASYCNRYCNASSETCVGPVFDWYGNGDVEFTGADPDRVFHVSAASAGYLR
jgi:hypothetical protein